jgi:hypothetical protein
MSARLTRSFHVADEPLGAGELIARFGGHPLGALGVDLETSDGLGRWLVMACLYGGRVDDAVAAEAVRGLASAGLADPSRIAEASPEALESLLDAAEYPAPDVAARMLWRVSDALAKRYGGCLDALANQSDQLEDLASHLASLAPGFGAARVARFLRPLRDRWPVAREIPLQPAARAAAQHLGLLREGEDEEGEPGALRAALRSDPASPTLADAEYALERLGARACRRNRTARCPLGEDCPYTMLAPRSGKD